MLKLLALVLGPLLIQGCSTTVLTARCDDPRVSNSNVPFVYMVMLPYVARGVSGAAIDSTRGIELTTVARLEALRMAAQTSDMHLTLLEPVAGECDIGKVYSEFVRPRSQLKRKLMASVVFYWGEVFPDGANMLVQSHVRLLWNSPGQRSISVLRKRLPTDDPGVTFSAELPYTTISFPPRLVARTNPPAADRQLAGALPVSRAYAAPDRSADARPVPVRFTLGDHKTGWVELKPANSADSVWIALDREESQVRGILPELSFAHAVASFVNYRKSGLPEAAADTRRWLRAFREGYARANDPLLRRPAAVADAIEGVLDFGRVGDLGGTATARAVALFDRAADAVPDNSAILNLAAVSKIRRCCASADSARAILDQFERARALDAGNVQVAQNLLNWYREMERIQPRLSAVELAQLRSKAASLAAALGE